MSSSSIKVEVLVGNQEDDNNQQQIVELPEMIDQQSGNDILYVVDNSAIIDEDFIFTTDNMVVGEDGEEYLVLTTGTNLFIKQHIKCSYQMFFFFIVFA